MRSRSVLSVLGAALLASVAYAQNNSQFRDWKPAALADAVQAKPKAACATLVGLTGYELSITTARVVPASADVPEHCRVSGQIQPEVRFELVLPASWNGRLHMFGNGGYAGEALDSPGRNAARTRALARGFAVVDTDTGHDAAVEPLGTFAASRQKFLDFAYRAVHVTATTAKRIVQSYYAGALRHSYFDGCSTGGRQGLISAQRFPDDFDGIVVGAPVLDFTLTVVSYVWNQKALAAAPIAADKLKIIADKVYATCDGVDGVTDGVIDDPRRCSFKPAADLPRCAGDVDGATCFTGAQIAALETIYGGVKQRGADLFPGQPVGAENGWTPWLVSPGPAANVETLFGETFFKNFAFGRPMPKYEWLTFNVDADLDKLQWERGALDATDPDLSRFKSRGGKILSYYGWADPALNPLMGVRYYESVLEKMGASTADFYRLFMVPGMFHCGGGVGTSTFDAITPLVEWVERGVVPQSIPASRIVSGNVVRTRPLCPYPQVAKYKGSGSIDEAANFTCVKP